MKFEVEATGFSELKKNIYPFESHFVDIFDYEMHYIDEGESLGQKPTILMVHGNPTWSFYYRDLVKQLSSQYRCIAIDHIGCGLSQRSDHFLRLNDRIAHLVEFIEKLSLENVHLVAHDWGGAIGMGTVLKKPDVFSSVTLLNTGAFTSDDIPKRIAICKVPFIGSVLNRGFNGFLKAANMIASKKGLSNLVKKGYLLPYLKYEDRKAIDDFVHDIPMNEDHPSYQTLMEIELGLENVKIPTQLLWGAKDFCFHIGFHKRFLEVWPNSKSKVFNKAGHYVLEDNFEQCLDEIREFIQ